MDDVQSAWVLLNMSAVPRSNHLVRILPPTTSQDYSTAHDTAIWNCFCNILGAGALRDDLLAKRIASLPGRLGGLGLRSASRTAAGAYWASWATSFPIIRAKAPPVAAAMLRELQSAAGPAALVLRELLSSRQQLEHQGALDLPDWKDMAKGVEPPVSDKQHADGADFAHGWQHYACSFSETHFFEQEVAPNCDDARRAMLFSQAGGAAGAFLRAIPSETSYTMSSLCFQWQCAADYGGPYHSQAADAAITAHVFWTLWGTMRLRAPRAGNSNPGRSHWSAFGSGFAVRQVPV